MTALGREHPRPDVESWRAQAVCRGMDPGLFFPEQDDRRGMAAAKAVCAGCPVREECLEANLLERDGVWGGLSGKQRQAVRVERLGKRRSGPIRHGSEGGYRAHRRRGEDPCHACMEAQRTARLRRAS